MRYAANVIAVHSLDVECYNIFGTRYAHTNITCIYVYNIYQLRYRLHVKIYVLNLPTHAQNPKKQCFLRDAFVYTKKKKSSVLVYSSSLGRKK